MSAFSNFKAFFSLHKIVPLIKMYLPKNQKQEIYMLPLHFVQNSVLLLGCLSWARHEWNQQVNLDMQKFNIDYLKGWIGNEERNRESLKRIRASGKDYHPEICPELWQEENIMIGMKNGSPIEVSLEEAKTILENKKAEYKKSVDNSYSLVGLFYKSRNPNS
jgi:hypothetical protein